AEGPHERAPRDTVHPRIFNSAIRVRPWSSAASAERNCVRDSSRRTPALSRIIHVHHIARPRISTICNVMLASVPPGFPEPTSMSPAPRETTPRAIVRVLPPASYFSESAAPATVTSSVRPTSRLDMLAEYNLYNNRREVSMNEDRTRVLLILSREILDKARVIAGKA